MSSIPRPGDTAPDFTAATDSGATVRLADLRGKKVVLYFYPMDDTPGCTIQACGFRDAYADFEGEGAVVLGISPDGAASHAAFRDKYDLPFGLLVDDDHAIAEAYGVWGEHVNRSHFVIDENGVIVEARRGVGPEESVAESLKAIRSL